MSSRHPFCAVLPIWRAEITQLRRNTVVLIAGAVVPLVMTVGTVFSVRNAEEEGAVVLGLGLLITLILGMSVYMSGTLTLTARREQLLLKRLRTSEARHFEILLGVTAPIAANGVVMLAVALIAVVAFGGAKFVAPAPLVVVISLLFLLCLAMAAATTGVVRGAEQADSATLPFFALLVGSAIWAVFEPDNPVLTALPGGALILGVRSAAMDLGAWALAWPALVSLTVWTALAAILAVKYFRWEPRH